MICDDLWLISGEIPNTTWMIYDDPGCSHDFNVDCRGNPWMICDDLWLISGEIPTKHG